MWSGKKKQNKNYNQNIALVLDVELKINNILLSSRSGLAHYAGYLSRTCLTAEPYVTARNTIECIYLPTADKWDADPATNPSFKHRQEMYANSSTKRLKTPYFLQ